jgi:dTDP-4-amino-4,6-dideoxygalactose transaminase
MNIDIEDVKRKITKRTRGIIPVHFAGFPCDMQAIMELSEKHSLRVVEDCAHAIEATIDGKHCGVFGDYGCFSFYITKNMTTIEGGMVVCRTEEQADKIKVMALHGMDKDAWHRFSDKGFVHYEVVEPGFKYNLTDLSASFGIHQLKRIETMYKRRLEIWEYYKKELVGLPLILPPAVPSKMRHALHLFICQVDDALTGITRDQLVQALHELRIGCGVHYTPIHLHHYYRETYGYRERDLPNAEYIGARTFSIPLSGIVTDEDAADVVRALKQVFE